LPVAEANHDCEGELPVVASGRDGVYIPKDLDDSIRELKKISDPENIAQLKSKEEKDLIQYHHGLGMYLRNRWIHGLQCERSRLGQYFLDLGVTHPDEMSSIIIKSFWRHLNEKDINLKEQLESQVRQKKNIFKIEKKTTRGEDVSELLSELKK